MTSREKDAEIARLTDELAREREAHAETRKMLGDALRRPAPTVFPIVVPLPQPVYSPVLPWIVQPQPFTVPHYEPLRVGDPILPSFTVTCSGSVH